LLELVVAAVSLAVAVGLAVISQDRQTLPRAPCTRSRLALAAAAQVIVEQVGPILFFLQSQQLAAAVAGHLKTVPQDIQAVLEEVAVQLLVQERPDKGMPEERQQQVTARQAAAVQVPLGRTNRKLGRAAMAATEPRLQLQVHL